MRSCINRALLYNPETNARWIPQEEAQQLVNMYRPIEGGFVNPEGVYEDELNAYLRGELDKSYIDDSIMWRQESFGAPPSGNIVTESLHYDLFDAPNTKYDIRTMPLDSLDLSDKPTIDFLQAVFGDSQRKGLYVPSLYVGWHLTVMPYLPGVTPREFMHYLNDCDWNRDVTKITKFKFHRHTDLSSVFPRDFFLRMTPVQQERLYDATIVTFKSEPLDLYKKMERDAKRKKLVLFQ